MEIRCFASEIIRLGAVLPTREIEIRQGKMRKKLENSLNNITYILENSC